MLWGFSVAWGDARHEVGNSDDWLCSLGQRMGWVATNSPAKHFRPISGQGMLAYPPVRGVHLFSCAYRPVGPRAWREAEDYGERCLYWMCGYPFWQPDEVAGGMKLWRQLNPARKSAIKAVSFRLTWGRTHAGPTVLRLLFP